VGGFCQPVGQLPARVEHARLDRGLGDADDVGNLLDRLVVIVDEIDDLGLLGRQPAQRSAQQFRPTLLLHDELRIVGRVRHSGGEAVV
jgi:hypothetical protein